MAARSRNSRERSRDASEGWGGGSGRRTFDWRPTLRAMDLAMDRGPSGVVRCCDLRPCALTPSPFAEEQRGAGEKCRLISVGARLEPEAEGE